MYAMWYWLNLKKTDDVENKFQEELKKTPWLIEQQLWKNLYAIIMIKQPTSPTFLSKVEYGYLVQT